MFKKKNCKIYRLCFTGKILKPQFYFSISFQAWNTLSGEDRDRGAALRAETISRKVEVVHLRILRGWRIKKSNLSAALGDRNSGGQT